MRLALIVGLMAAVSAPAWTQAKAGDKAMVDVQSTLELDIAVRDGSGPGETLRFLSLVRRETFEQEVLTVADGLPSSVRIKVASSTLQKSGTDTLLEEKSTALAGQTYTSMRGQGGWMAKDADGGAAPAEGAALGAWNDAGRLLPKTGLQAGGQWEVDAADAVALLSPAGVREAGGKLSCTCKALDANKASITFTGSLTGKAKNDARVTLAINTGVMEYDLSKGRPTNFSISGSFESLLSVEDEYRKPGAEGQVEKRKVGEIAVKSRKLTTSFVIR
jgi:hypothetical protein